MCARRKTANRATHQRRRVGERGGQGEGHCADCRATCNDATGLADRIRDLDVPPVVANLANRSGECDAHGVVCKQRCEYAAGQRDHPQELDGREVFVLYL